MAVWVALFTRASSIAPLNGAVLAVEKSPKNMLVMGPATPAVAGWVAANAPSTYKLLVPAPVNKNSAGSNTLNDPKVTELLKKSSPPEPAMFPAVIPVYQQVKPVASKPVANPVPQKQVVPIQ